MVLPPLLLLNALQQPLLLSLNQFRQLRGFAVRFALVRLSAVARISLSVSSVIPSCRPKEWSPKRGSAPYQRRCVRSEAKRVAIARLDLVLIFVKADSRVAACWIWSFCRRISSSKAAPVADTQAAISAWRVTSALRCALTCRVSCCKVFRPGEALVQQEMDRPIAPLAWGR